MCVPGIMMSILLVIAHLLLTIIPSDNYVDGGRDGDGNPHFIEKESEAHLCPFLVLSG